MSSRLVALAFCFVDALATMVTLINCSATMLLIVVSLVTSFGLACLSSVVRSVLWPRYFWDQVPRHQPSEHSLRSPY